MSWTSSEVGGLALDGFMAFTPYMNWTTLESEQNITEKERGIKPNPRESANEVSPSIVKALRNFSRISSSVKASLSNQWRNSG